MVPISRAPRRTAVAAPPHAPRSRSRGGTRRSRRRRRRRSTSSAPARVERLGDAGPAADQHPLTRLDQRRRRHRRGRARRPRPGCRRPASLASTSATGADELLVTNTTRCPAARNRPTAPAAPGIGLSASQTTPSRSRTTVIQQDPGTAGANLLGVPRFEPFPAIRYDAAHVDLDAVVRTSLRRARPTDERAELAARRPATTSSCVDCPVEADGPDRYERAATTLQQWLARRGARRRRATSPSTVYRMTFTDETGAPPDHHRRARRPRAEPTPASAATTCSRTSRRRPRPRATGSTSPAATGANLSPIWGLSLAKGLARR